MSLLTATAKRPARLDITDMPRDPQRSLGALRQAICASFNYCRNYPAKLAVLIEVLEYALARAKEYGTPEAEEAIQTARDAERAAQLQVLLDERKAVMDTAVAGIKSVATAEIKHAQGLEVLEELKELLVTTGFEVVGETIEEIKANYVTARTKAYKEASKVVKDEITERYAERVAAYETQQDLTQAAE